MDNSFYKPPPQARLPRAAPAPLLPRCRRPLRLRPSRLATPRIARLARLNQRLPVPLLMAWAAGAVLPAMAQTSMAQEAPRTDAGPAVPAADERRAPVVIEADAIRGRPGIDAEAEGSADLQQGRVRIRADKLSYDYAADLARAAGNVRIERDGDRFTGPELQMQLGTFQGFFVQPEYFLERTQAGGKAQRIDFYGSDRSRLTAATYTSCTPDGDGAPDWLLSADEVQLDLEANEGVARGAVLRFLGVPILGAPVLSFPLTDERKSGWLPPSISLDSKSGLELAVPYYWNIAPNLDATLTPTVLSRRGLGLDSEFRYLDPSFGGRVNAFVLPDDRVARRTRHSVQWQHDGTAPLDIGYRANVMRVSDDSYWKDFPLSIPWATERLLPTDLQADRAFGYGNADWTGYARLQHWQVLQDADPLARIAPPYQRSPQIGVRGLGALGGGFQYSLETEVNRFTLASGGTQALNEGSRWHALGAISRPWVAPGWWVTPRLSFNAASYRTDQRMTDGRTSASRVIPSFSLDSGMLFERDTRLFGRALRQTLEPRLLYVNTPFRDQSALPNFDAAGKDFNIVSVYSDNGFSGVDRVSDAHQLTGGVTTRLLSPDSGNELMRFSLVQRVLFRDQQVTPEGEPFTQRFSDLLLIGSSNLGERWTLDGALQYRPDGGRLTRSIVGARYSPGPFRTINARYRLARGFSEQVEVGWQWPLYTGRARAGGSCGNSSTYAVGRINYSVRDSRVTDSIIGLEYDAGCWIGRLVAERLSTGRTEATTRLMFQLELVGLSRLGSNPLGVLKDNIPGYQLLRERRSAPPDPTVYE
jgi:LPS-assembly protein